MQRAHALLLLDHCAGAYGPNDRIREWIWSGEGWVGTWVCQFGTSQDTAYDSASGKQGRASVFPRNSLGILAVCCLVAAGTYGLHADNSLSRSDMRRSDPEEGKLRQEGGTDQHVVFASKWVRSELMKLKTELPSSGFVDYIALVRGLGLADEDEVQH
eukprot:4538190-Amphidinium_carterae.1